jgi:hypothetical protein
MEPEVESLLQELEKSLTEIYSHWKVFKQDSSVSSEDHDTLAADAKAAGQASIASFMQSVTSILNAVRCRQKPISRRKALLQEIQALEEELQIKVCVATDRKWHTGCRMQHMLCMPRVLFIESALAHLQSLLTMHHKVHFRMSCGRCV